MSDEGYKVCKACGGRIPVDDSRVCPLCGVDVMVAEPGHHETTGAPVGLTPPHDLLLQAARLAKEILAQTACEVLSEQLIRALITKKGLSIVEDWIEERVYHSFSPSVRSIRRLYRVLSGGDDLVPSQIKGRYDKHLERRNDVVHRGVQPDASQAAESYEVAVELTTYLAEQLGRLS